MAAPKTERPSASPAAETRPDTPYGALARHYDVVMEHVDYPGWASHYRGLWRGAQGGRKPPGRLLELAAGTCRFASPPLFPEAFAVHTDRSVEMLRRAAPGTLRVACDARALPFKSADALGVSQEAAQRPDQDAPSGASQDVPAGAKNASAKKKETPDGAFDMVLMAYDSLNYLLRPDEVVRALEEARRLLRPGGLFLFDVTTPACSRRHFADTLDFQDLTGCAVLRASRYDSETRMQLNLFTFFEEGPDGRYDRREEVHRQRVYPAAALKKMAREAGFSLRACLGDFTLKPGTDRDERLHFVLQKP